MSAFVPNLTGRGSLLSFNREFPNGDSENYSGVYMKILVHGINYAPDLIGIAKYTTEMCEYFRQRGHQVVVVTAPPYYPYWEIQRPYRAYVFARELIGQIRVFRCPLYVPKSPRALQRILHHLSFAITSAPLVVMAALRFRPDVVIAIAPSLLGSPGVIAAARLCGAAAWLHIQDFEIDAAFNLHFVSGHFFKRVALRIERMLLRCFDQVSSISTNMARTLERKGVPPSRVIEFRNWVDMDAIFPVEGPTKLRRSLGLPIDATLVMYSGNMGTKQGLEYLALAAERLAKSRPDIVFLFCGAGSTKAQLQRLTTILPNVRHAELQPVEALAELLSTTDIHLLPQRPEALDLVLPSKLAGMLASGRPVIAMASAGSQIATELDGIGMIVPPGDVDALVAAIIQLVDDSDLRRQLGAKGCEVARSRWDRGAVLPQIDVKLRGLRSSASIARAARQPAEGMKLRVHPRLLRILRPRFSSDKRPSRARSLTSESADRHA